jgi:hypothetical protein
VELVKQRGIVARGGVGPRLFLELLILQDFKSSRFGTVGSKGVTDEFCGTADCAEVSGEILRVRAGCANFRLRIRILRPMLAVESKGVRRAFFGAVDSKGFSHYR